jgi:hypothetical protein
MFFGFLRDFGPKNKGDKFTYHFFVETLFFLARSKQQKVFTSAAHVFAQRISARVL